MVSPFFSRFFRNLFLVLTSPSQSIILEIISNYAQTIFQKSQKYLPFLKFKTFLILIFLTTFFIGGISPATSSIVPGKSPDIDTTRNTILILINVFFSFLTLGFLFLSIKKIIFYRFEFLLILLVCIISFTSVFSYNYSNSILFIASFIRCLIAYLVFSRITEINNWYSKSLIFLLLLSSLEGFLGLGQFMKGNTFYLPFESVVDSYNISRVMITLQGSSYLRALGTFSHPNLLANFMAILFPLFLSLLYLHRPNFILKFTSKKLYRTLVFGSIVLVMLLIIVTFSRWAYFSTVVGILGFLFLGFLNGVVSVSRQKLSIILIPILLILIVFLPFISQRLILTPTTASSFDSRIGLIEQSFFMIQQNPILGVGGGTFRTYFENNDFTQMKISTRFWAMVHNFYLLLTAETGIFSTIAYLLFVFSIYVIGFTKLRKTNSIQTKFHLIALLSAITVYLVVSFWEPLTFSDRRQLLGWVLMGLLVNISLSRNSKPEKSPIP